MMQMPAPADDPTRASRRTIPEGTLTW
jgi:hypothetical protein